VELKADMARTKLQDTTETWIDFRRKLKEVSADKRHFPRLEFHCSVLIHGVHKISRVTDFSMGGIFVECEDPSAFEKGQTINLTMKLPNEVNPVKIKAKVADMRDRGIGLRFVDLTPANQEILRFCFNTFKDTLPLK
jgi:c-di-GMP-binding flagellar brake protein YcgR